VTSFEYGEGDLDALDELERSRGFAIYRGRIEAELERRRVELERPLDAAGTAETRGRIAALRTVLAIGGILRAEIQESLEEMSHGG
jgi:hypothetical protein